MKLGTRTRPSFASENAELEVSVTQLRDAMKGVDSRVATAQFSEIDGNVYLIFVNEAGKEIVKSDS